MALTFTETVLVNVTTNSNSYTSSAITPIGNRALVLAILADHTSLSEFPSSLSTPSWLSGSWVPEADVGSGTDQRLMVWSGKTVASPSADTLNATFSTTHAGCIIYLVSIDNFDPTDFVIQVQPGSGIGATSASLTLPSGLGSSNNACLAFFSQDSVQDKVPAGGETQLSEVTHTAPTRSLVAQYEFNDTTSGVTWTTADAWRGVALEIKQLIDLTQILRPTSTITVNGWLTNSSGTDLHTAIDETTFNDSDYIISAASPASADISEVKFAAGTDPGSSVGHKIRYRYKKDATGGDQINLTVRLIEGTTTIASWSHTNIDAVTTAEQTLSSGEANSITDYTDLRLRFEAIKP